MHGASCWVDQCLDTCMALAGLVSVQGICQILDGSMRRSSLPWSCAWSMMWPCRNKQPAYSSGGLTPLDHGQIKAAYSTCTHESDRRHARTTLRRPFSIHLNEMLLLPHQTRYISLLHLMACPWTFFGWCEHTHRSMQLQQHGHTTVCIDQIILLSQPHLSLLEERILFLHGDPQRASYTCLFMPCMRVYASHSNHSFLFASSDRILKFSAQQQLSDVHVTTVLRMLLFISSIYLLFPCLFSLPCLLGQRKERCR